jgi:hypothetical protein
MKTALLVGAGLVVLSTTASMAAVFHGDISGTFATGPGPYIFAPPAPEGETETVVIDNASATASQGTAEVRLESAPTGLTTHAKFSDMTVDGRARPTGYAYARAAQVFTSILGEETQVYGLQQYTIQRIDFQYSGFARARASRNGGASIGVTFGVFDSATGDALEQLVRFDDEGDMRLPEYWFETEAEDYRFTLNNAAGPIRVSGFMEVLSGSAMDIHVTLEGAGFEPIPVPAPALLLTSGLGLLGLGAARRRTARNRG